MYLMMCPYRIDCCNFVLVGLQRQHFLPSNGSRIQPLGLFLALVDNPTSAVLYNNFTGYRQVPNRA